MDRQWWLHFRPSQSPVIYNPLCPLWRESTSSSANISGLIQFGAALWRGVVVMVVVVGPCCVGCGFLLSPGWSSDHHSCVTHCHTCQVSFLWTPQLRGEAANPGAILQFLPERPSYSLFAGRRNSFLLPPHDSDTHYYQTFNTQMASCPCSFNNFF